MCDQSLTHPGSDRWRAQGRARFDLETVLHIAIMVARVPAGHAARSLRGGHIWSETDPKRLGPKLIVGPRKLPRRPVRLLPNVTS